MMINNITQSKVEYSVVSDPFSQFPDEIILKIFLNLGRKDLVSAGLVNKRWNAIAKDKCLLKQLTIKENAIGAEKWYESLGEVDQEPLFPNNIYEILESDCPFWKGKKVKETHMLVLIPSKIKGVGSEVFEDFTLNKLKKLVQNSKKGKGINFECYCPKIKEIIGNNPVENPYWVLMTKDVIPKSRGKSRAKQIKLALNKEEGRRAPKILEAVACILINYFATGERLYSDQPLTYTVCQEKFYGWKKVVGGFSSSRLHIYCSHYLDGNVGVSSLACISSENTQP